MRHAGSCHCGNLKLEFETALDPAALPLRACQCSFCRRHVALSTSDPAGSVRVSVTDASELQRYRFGLGITDFVICRRCGVYLLAMMEIDSGLYAVLNANVLECRAAMTGEIQPMEYGGEDEAARLARRKTRWTRVTALEGLWT
ncbi:MAG TPA: aldehyde-activating protein [Gammaproteobacteria bacterium]|jgi:hypothetical protein